MNHQRFQIQIMSNIEDLQQRLENFRDARGWRDDHTLKDLAAAISIEAGELQELLLWERVEDERQLVEARGSELADELADVVIHCLNFASAAGIDVARAVQTKIDRNEARFPIAGDPARPWSK